MVAVGRAYMSVVELEAARRVVLVIATMCGCLTVVVSVLVTALVRA